MNHSLAWLLMCVNVYLCVHTCVHMCYRVSVEPLDNLERLERTVWCGVREFFVMAQARRSGLGDLVSWGQRDTDPDSCSRMCVANMIRSERRHTAHIPDTRVKLGRVLAPITANHLLTECESSSQFSTKRNPAVPETSRGVFSVSFGRKHLWMLSYHRWYLCINTHFEGAVVGKIKARFQQLPLSFGPPHHQAWDNCFLSLELWVLHSEGVLTASSEYVISSRAQRRSCKLRDACVSFSFFGLCGSAIKISFLATFLCGLHYKANLLEREWERARQGTLSILRIIDFNKAIHIPFMPQMKLIYNVYNPKRDSISTILAVQIQE